MGNVISGLLGAKEAPRCTYTTSKRCFGAKSTGGPFCEEFYVNYMYACCRCSLVVSKKGIAKRVDRVCVSLLDKDHGSNNNVVVDADVVVTADTCSYGSCSSSMTVRNNLAPHKGVLENWAQSFNSVEAIRYFTPTRHGMFSLTTPNNNNNVPNNTRGSITHYFSTSDDNMDAGAGYSVEVKYKLEGCKGLRVHVEGPNFVPNICFSDRVEIQDYSSTPLLHTSLTASPAKEEERHGDGYLRAKPKTEAVKTRTPQYAAPNNPNVNKNLKNTSLTQKGGGSRDLAKIELEGSNLIDKFYGTSNASGSIQILYSSRNDCFYN